MLWILLGKYLGIDTLYDSSAPVMNLYFQERKRTSQFAQTERTGCWSLNHNIGREFPGSMR